MPTLQSADLWRESGRYDDYGKEMLRIKDRHERDLLYGPTNEELITDIFRSTVRSYKSLPLNLYHIQWKFRDEVRPRFWRDARTRIPDERCVLIRRRRRQRAARVLQMFVAYLRTFGRMGLKSVPMRADTGPIGGDLSYEFIVLADTGESQVFCHKDLVDMPIPRTSTSTAISINTSSRARPLYAATDEKHDPEAFEKIPEDKRLAARGIEVGHISISAPNTRSR